MTLRALYTPRRKPLRGKKVLRKRVLGAEMLETRALMSAAGAGQELLAATPAHGATSASQPADLADPPYLASINDLVGSKVSGITVQKRATATPSTVTGTAAVLSVRGVENGSDSGLSYTWATTGSPPASVVFSLNGANLAKSTTVTFGKAGKYLFQVTIADANGRSVTSSVSVTVKQTLKSIVITPDNVNLDESQTQQFTAAACDQFGNGMGTTPKIKWAKASGVGSISAGGLYQSPAGVGSAAITASSGSIVGRASVSVADATPTVANPATANPATVTGTTTALSVLGADDGGERNLTYQWAATSEAPATVAFSLNGTNAAKNTVATFTQAGTYTFQVTMTDKSGLSATTSVTVVVNQTLTSLTVTPNNVTVAPGATQQFAASALDQFGSALATQPAITWSAGAGEITPGGLFTAPQTNGPTTVTAASGAASASAALFIGVFPALNDAALAAYIESLDADGSISRNDMIQILKFVAAENGGVLSSADFSDLQTIVADAAALDMPNYVQVLASNVVNGNPANAGYQGQPLGNLAAGSTATQLTELMDKWFLGTDHPAANANTVGNTPYAYASFAGDPLFAKGGPTIQDEHQQDLGDCYLISSLGSIANASPSSIENMFIDNGDGTYTVRFYYFPVPGFADGQADYVTVDSMLPVNDGRPVYSAPGAENSLWLPLAEKAYAEWNETGKELSTGNPQVNSYASIQSGWMSYVYLQVLGARRKTTRWTPPGSRPSCPRWPTRPWP